jgi:hypothetical protein
MRRGRTLARLPSRSRSFGLLLRLTAAIVQQFIDQAAIVARAGKKTARAAGHVARTPQTNVATDFFQDDDVASLDVQIVPKLRGEDEPTTLSDVNEVALLWA